MDAALTNMSLIIGIAALLTIVSRLIKQPPIIAYLLAGVLSGPLFFNLLGPDVSGVLQILARVGVAFLLFIVGLSLDFGVLKEIGSVSIIGGSIGMLITGVIGFFISTGLGFSATASLYLSAVLAFSSTVVVVKILSDKKEISSLHGRISLGILIAQDIAAALVLMLVPIVTEGGSFSGILNKFGIVFGIILAVFLVSYFLFGRFMNYLASSSEALFLFGIAWALVLATLFARLGFSLEIGALIAGMSLASSQYSIDLGCRIKPLRDFFVVLLFVFFGSQLAGAISGKLLMIALSFSAFALVGKPLITMLILKFYGYPKKVNFLVGVSLAQISEFSLILTLLGFTLGQINQEIMSLTVIIAITTIGLSSYGIYYSGQLFKLFSPFLNLFDGNRHVEGQVSGKKYEVFLFGYHRLGYQVLKAVKEMKKSFLVIDYNPKVILALKKSGIDCIYGDASDKEFLGELPLNAAKIVISTLSDEDSNFAIQENMNKINSAAIFIATAEQPRNALNFYEKGADYVLIPHHLGGDYASGMIKQFQLDRKKYRQAGSKHEKEIIDAMKSSKYSNSRFFY